MRLNMDLFHTVDSFEEIGMVNPFTTEKCPVDDAIDHVKNMLFDYAVYP